MKTKTIIAASLVALFVISINKKNDETRKSLKIATSADYCGCCDKGGNPRV